ncbi:MAG TPA: GTP-binding protein [Acidimicrobiales bacterium]|nr:GTP-binding protein [Acidimicrobiales bacterium]
MAGDDTGGANGTALLRFAAVGSVDDGKSTLIGRLLHDTKQLFDDQLEAISTASRRRGVDGVDLSFVTDGLRAEREQGITIDVAYRYAATPNRKFVIADCPGHVQYTRNMATGASTADLAVVVVDATAGLREQTRRHCCIAALLGVRHLVVAANKLDLTGWDEAASRRVGEEMDRLAERLGVETVLTVPVSALHGDNVVERSTHTPWYDGPTILQALEDAPAGAWATEGAAGARLPVQWVVRHPGGGRSYAGMVSGGTLRAGDEVVVLPGGAKSRILSVGTFDGALDEAASSLSVTVALEDDLDVARGDLIAAADGAPEVLREFDATLCWFGERPVSAGARFRIKHTTRVTPAVLTSLAGRLDVDRLTLQPAAELGHNDIGVGRLTVATPVAADPYHENRVTGSFVVIDEATNATVAAGMVGAPVVLGAGAGTTAGAGATAG